MKKFSQNKDSMKYSKLLAFNQGFYNFFLAIGSLVGVILLFQGQNIPEAKVLIGFSNACMAGAAMVLVYSNKSFYRAAIIQGLPPTLAIISLFL